MAKTTTKKRALRAFRDALMMELFGDFEPDSVARQAERGFATALKRALEGAPSVSIPGLGTFRRTTRKAREVPNPNRFMNDWDSGEGDSTPVGYIQLPETHSVRFSPCGEWRRSLK